jgi:hypothetical protein
MITFTEPVHISIGSKLGLQYRYVKSFKTVSYCCPYNKHIGVYRFRYWNVWKRNFLKHLVITVKNNCV